MQAKASRTGHRRPLVLASHNGKLCCRHKVVGDGVTAGIWAENRQCFAVLPAECFGRGHNGRPLGRKAEMWQKRHSIFFNILSFKNNGTMPCSM